ncbi:hypothetical protein G7Z17_g569 [Cylindrodendrum hubeiense]|uniref:Uncharacterized protein n=1 Tax=Cylindrodendrum hubeiense TaxID=595255 RepID=A0A9P5LDA0_9HYPO|nr:hypothetical protein G7Z17_g569 [Cylindrodendrum hubeiense]
MDLQASFGQASKPLTDSEEGGCAPSLPAHVNDSDFGPATKDAVPDREGLTDMTFSLITYHAMPSGRLVISALQKKTASGVGGDDSGVMAASPSASNALDTDLHMQYLQRFEQQAFTLLRFCDPESSPYSWFTWHNTQCFVAATRLSALRPLQAASPPRMQDHTELLRLTLTVLENTRLVHTDPRGEGFRWWVNIPWHALAIAFAECYAYEDKALVRQVWPLVEASYQLHRAAIETRSDGILHGPLANLMRRAREKLAPTFQDDPVASRSPSEMIATPSPWVPGTTMTPDSESPIEAADVSLIQTQIWNPHTLFADHQSALATDMPTAGSPPSMDVSDESWQMWEEFVADISFEDFGSPSMFLYENSNE